LFVKASFPSSQANVALKLVLRFLLLSKMSF